LAKLTKSFETGVGSTYVASPHGEQNPLLAEREHRHHGCVVLRRFVDLLSE